MKSNQDGEWEVVIKDWESSELSRREYCKRSGIKEHQLSYWHQKLGKVTEELPKFVSILNVNSWIELEIGKVKLKLPVELSSQRISEIIKCLS